MHIVVKNFVLWDAEELLAKGEGDPPRGIRVRRHSSLESVQGSKHLRFKPIGKADGLVKCL